MGVQAGDNWLLLDRDREWENILKLCEKSQDYETLDALQALNDNTFEILSGLYPAHESLLKALDAYEDMDAVFNTSSFYGQEQDVVLDIIEDIEQRIEHVTREYFKNLDQLIQ